MNARIALAAVALVGGCVFVAGDATLTVHNHTTHRFTELYLAEHHDWNWGPNLVSAMMPGQDVVLTGIACGRYDVLAVDEYGRSCEVVDLSLCADDHHAVFTNAWCGW